MIVEYILTSVLRSSTKFKNQKSTKYKKFKMKKTKKKIYSSKVLEIQT